MGLVPVLPWNAIGRGCVCHSGRTTFRGPMGMGKMPRNPFWGGRLVSHSGVLLGRLTGHQREGTLVPSWACTALPTFSTAMWGDQTEPEDGVDTGPPGYLVEVVRDVPVILLALGEEGSDAAWGACCPSPLNKAPSLFSMLFLPIAGGRGTLPLTPLKLESV